MRSMDAIDVCLDEAFHCQALYYRDNLALIPTNTRSTEALSRSVTPTECRGREF